MKSKCLKTGNEKCHTCAFFDADWPHQICHKQGRNILVGEFAVGYNDTNECKDYKPGYYDIYNNNPIFDKN